MVKRKILRWGTRLLVKAGVILVYSLLFLYAFVFWVGERLKIILPHIGPRDKCKNKALWVNGYKFCSRVYRRRFILAPIVVLIVLTGQRVYSRNHSTWPDKQQVFPCDPTLIHNVETIPELPDAHYLYSKRYGWFDRTHFNTGEPGQLLADVQAAVEQGGGRVVIQQGVRDNLTGYSAVYTITGPLTEADTLPVALGIYTDWSIRFEAWQADPPQGLFGPLTPFAVEDLPSQYLGFYAATHELSIGSLFACYLGPVIADEEGPPDFVAADATSEIDGVLGLTRLQNHTFTPRVETEIGWQYVQWPEPLQMESSPSGSHTWQFVSEETWYGQPDE